MRRSRLIVRMNKYEIVIVSDINNFGFGLAKASTYGSGRIQGQKFLWRLPGL